MAEANGWRKRDDFTLRLQTARVQVAEHRGWLGRYHRGCARFADRRQLLQSLLCACIAQCPDGQRAAARPKFVAHRGKRIRRESPGEDCRVAAKRPLASNDDGPKVYRRASLARDCERIDSRPGTDWRYAGRSAMIPRHDKRP